jgi:hypothetical protein
MDQPPAGAQYSPDGAYWWDETDQQWKLVSSTGVDRASVGAQNDAHTAPDQDRTPGP